MVTLISPSSGCLRGEEKSSRALCLAKSKGRAWNSERVACAETQLLLLMPPLCVTGVLGDVVSHPRAQFPYHLTFSLGIQGWLVTLPHSKRLCPCSTQSRGPGSSVVAPALTWGTPDPSPPTPPPGNMSSGSLETETVVLYVTGAFARKTV